MIFRTGAGDNLINVGVAWILSLKTRVLQKIHNLYLVVIGQMFFADGAEVGDGAY